MSKQQSPEAQARYEAFQDATQRMRDLVKKQEQLTSSKTECEMVSAELSQLKAEEPVYKLMGKMMILQDLGDAKANVTQRLQMIDRELEKLDKQLAEQQAAVTARRGEAIKAQQEAQAASSAASTPGAASAGRGEE